MTCSASWKDKMMAQRRVHLTGWCLAKMTGHRWACQKELHLAHHLGLSLKSSNATGSESLTELLDGLILLYHVGVHKHYVKVNHNNNNNIRKTNK